MSFPSRPEYESLIYGLLDAYPEVIGSTLRLYSTSALTAIVEGQVQLANGLGLRVVEALDFKAGRQCSSTFPWKTAVLARTGKSSTLCSKRWNV